LKAPPALRRRTIRSTRTKSEKTSCWWSALAHHSMTAVSPISAELKRHCRRPTPTGRFAERLPLRLSLTIFRLVTARRSITWIRLWSAPLQTAWRISSFSPPIWCTALSMTSWLRLWTHIGTSSPPLWFPSPFWAKSARMRQRSIRTRKRWPPPLQPKRWRRPAMRVWTQPQRTALPLFWWGMEPRIQRALLTVRCRPRCRSSAIQTSSSAR